MNKFKAGDVVVCIDDRGVTGITLGNLYKITEPIGSDHVSISNDFGNWYLLMAKRFKLAGGENMYKINKAEAQAKINEIKKELAKLEEIVNAPDEPKFQPFTVEINNAAAAAYLLETLGARTWGMSTHKIYNEIRDKIELQIDSRDIDVAINWLKSQS